MGLRLLLITHPWEDISLFDLRPLIPPPLDLRLVHLDHLLIVEVLRLPALVAIPWGEKQLVSQFLAGDLVVGARGNISFVVCSHLALFFGVVALGVALFHLFELVLAAGRGVAVGPTLGVGDRLGGAQLLVDVLFFDCIIQLFEIPQVDFGDVFYVFFILLAHISRLRVALPMMRPSLRLLLLVSTLPVPGAPLRSVLFIRRLAAQNMLILAIIA